MDNTVTNNSYPFLSGGGEMGALTRDFNWAGSPLGAPGSWPQSLRTALSILLNSRFPMFLFWGEEHTCFYNDAYRPSLGNDGKHPHALGKPAEEVWHEIWPLIHPLIIQVRSGEGGTWSEDQLIPIYRNGGIEDVYWTFGYSPVSDESGTISGVLVTCVETTEKVANVRQLEESRQQLEFAVEATELATWDLNPVTNTFTGNARYTEWFGIAASEHTDNARALNVIAEEDRQRVIAAYTKALDYAAGSRYDIEYTIRPEGRPERIVRAKGRAWFGEDKKAYRFNGTLQDITAERKAEAGRAAAQQLADIAIKSAGIGLFRVDMLSGEMDYSPAYAAIMTGDAGRKNGTREMFAQHIHPDDEGLRRSTIKAALEKGEFQFEPRVKWDDGSVHRVRVMGACQFDEAHRPTVLSGTVKDITEEEKAARELRDAEDRFSHAKRESDAMFRNVINSAPTGLWLSDEEGGLTYLNKTLVEWTDMPYDALLGAGWASAIIDEDRARSAETFLAAVAARAHYDVIFRMKMGDGDVIWCRAAGDPYYREDGSYAGYAGYCMDIDELLAGRGALSQSEARFRSIVEQAPMAIALLSGRDMIIEVGNEKVFEVWGKDKSITGMRVIDALPEIEGQGFIELLESVYDTGEPFFGNGVLAKLKRSDRLENVYFDFAYTPLRGTKGVVGVMVLATEVTDQVLARKKTEESEAKFRSLIEEAPVATCLFTGRDMKIEVANEGILQIWGKDRSVIGMPLAEALPVLKGQPFLHILDEVFTTGKTYEGKGAPADLEIDGVTGTYYFDFTYKPLRNAAGDVYGIMNMAVDVTDTVLAREKIIESGRQLLALFEESPVGIATISGDDDLVFETVNAFYGSLTGRAPSDLIGKPLLAALPELQGQGFDTLLRGVISSGEPFTASEAPVEMYRNGVLEKIYINFTYQPRRSSDGRVTGVLVVAVDVTQQVQARQKVEESAAQIRSLVESAPFPIGVYTGREMRILLANQAITDVWGKGPDVVGKLYTELLPELKGQGIFDQLTGVYDTGIAYHSGTKRVDIERDGATVPYYFNYSFTPLFDGAGNVYGVMNTAAEVTVLETARLRAEHAEERLRGVIAAAPAGIGIFVGRDLIIENPNGTFIDIVGKGPGIMGLPLREAMPELLTEGQPFLKILDDVFTTGVPFISPASLVKIERNGVLNDNYYNISYTPLYDGQGEVYAILDIAVDVTAQIKAQQQLEESELFSRSIIDNSPVAKVVFTGEDMVIERVNQGMLAMLGRDNGIIGKPFLEAMPELRQTPIMERLRNVFATGETFYQPEERIDLIRFGQPYTGYYNYIYKALRNTAGEIYGIVVAATEVTDGVLARQQVEEAEAGLRGAIELAALGTWSIDVETNALTYSDRLIEWFGYDPAEEDYSKVIPILSEEDQERVSAAVARALRAGSDGIYDEIYTVIHPVTGGRRILHAQGKTVFDINGRPVRMNGTAQDITMQRELQTALENEVQERTLELAAINEELTAINEELAESNSRLVHSNEELAQYAYVASHDLQEPLRKILVFSGMLDKKEALSPESKPLVDKISQSAERMSQLIRDLLDFSRLLKSDALVRPVNLKEITTAVVSDFELIIAEKSAVVSIGDMPVIQAIGLQMNQLFYNLLGNALKFSKQDTTPIVRIHAEKISGDEVVRHIPKPLPFAQYYHITVTDNGIGFDVKYSEQIFEVFKRLHGREMYPGSGIGLALCRRIVDNHNGRLYAMSTPGVGTIFHLILPDRQQDYASALPDGYQWSNS